METVEIVIKMPKDIYESFNESFNDPFDKMWKHYLIPCAYAIRNGTVLPKGHGRLIDADKLKEEIGLWDNDYTEDGYVHVIEESDIDDAPTIIEPDGEE